MDNVVQFPKQKKNSPPQNLEELQSNLDAVRTIHIEETMAMLAGTMFDQLAVSGFDFDTEDGKAPDDIKDVALVFESIRSLLMKQYGMNHPFQGMSDNLFSLQADGTVLCSHEAISKLTTQPEGKA